MTQLPPPTRAWSRVAGAALAFLFLPLLLAACAADPAFQADALAAPAHLQLERLQAGPFVLTAYARISAPAQPLHLYIEGDGYAWATRTEPSPDPTPRQAMGLALAAADTSPNVVYLARPCQYTPRALNPACGPAYWTDKRYAPEVAAAMDEAVSHYAALLTGPPRLDLIGYSGGAALAVLVAARRSDVASLRTVAGNLDSEYVNRLHHVSAMPTSLNPIDSAPRLAATPQLHFSGEGDPIVPPSVAERFAAAAGGHCVHTYTVRGLAHEGDWPRLWPRLLEMPVHCGA
jgi:predicted esterase